MTATTAGATDSEVSVTEVSVTDVTVNDVTQDAAELGELTATVMAGQERKGADPAGLWPVLAQAGVLGAALPEVAGGSGLGLAGDAAVLGSLGRAVARTSYRDAIAVAAAVLARHGSPAQRRQWLEPAVLGELRLATAWREPAGALGDLPMTTAAVAEGGWVLNGTKTLVGEGMAADLLLVTASGPDGPLLFAVPAEAPGLRRETQLLVDSMLGAQAAWIELENVPVSAGQLVGADGSAVLNDLLVRHTLAVCAEQAGVLASAVQLTAAHARERQQFGRPLGAFQAVSQRVADAYVDVRAAELTLREALRVCTMTGLDADSDSGAGAGGPLDAGVVLALQTAAYWATEAGHRVAHTCVHIHGGTGLDLDHPAHRHFATAKRLEFELGGATAALLMMGERLAG